VTIVILLLAQAVAGPPPHRPPARLELDTAPRHDPHPDALDYFREVGARHGFLSDAVDRVLSLPCRALEATTYLLLPDRVTYNGLTIFDQAGDEDLSSIFLRTFLKRESHYAASFALRTGDDEPDLDDFRHGQVKVLLDSLKRAYRERYHIPTLDLETIFSAFGSGNVVDALLMPAAAIAYTYRFGIDRRWGIRDVLQVEFKTERPARILRVLHRKGHRPISSLSLQPFKLPFKLIATLDTRDGGFELGFIGIGSDVTAVNDALEASEEEDEE